MGEDYADRALTVRARGADLVDTNLLPAIKETIRQNEIGDQTPYSLSFAKLGKSGASFGIMQGDTNVSGLARDTLRKTLSAAGVDKRGCDRILAALGKALPNGNPLSGADTKLVNAALASKRGVALVDAMDASLMQTVADGLDACTAAGATRQLGLAPLAVLYIAPWINMSGPPSLLIAWLKGSSVFGLAPPAPPQLTAEEMQAYLQGTAYFQAHPRNFLHYQKCVEEGAGLLPRDA